MTQPLKASGDWVYLMLAPGPLKPVPWQLRASACLQAGRIGAALSWSALWPGQEIPQRPYYTWLGGLVRQQIKTEDARNPSSG